MPAAFNSDRQEIAAIVAALERATGLKLCLKVFEKGASTKHRLALLEHRLCLHGSDFCIAVKVTRNAHCIECDLRKVPALCMPMVRPFVHFCHAGAGEVIIPIYRSGLLAGIGYLGQFRRPDEGAEELPVKQPEEEQYLLSLAKVFSSFLAEQITTPLHESETSRGYRGEAIKAYMESQLARNPSLSDLAQHLGLSPDRAAHVTKEALGCSFVTLRNEIRLERACLLLRQTYSKVAVIAEECGFESPQYFHRFFLQKTGMTPTKFRRQSTLEA